MPFKAFFIKYYFLINHKFHNSPYSNEKFEETYEGSPLLDYEKLKRWARWIVRREVFDKIIFGMTKICLK